MIILYELIDFIKVIRIKMFALNAEVFDLVQDSLESLSKLIELQNFSQLARDSIVGSFLTCFCN